MRVSSTFPLYVASEDRLTALGVLGRVWRHVPNDGERLSLIELPTRSRDLYRASRCLGRYFTDDDRSHRRRIAPVSAPPRQRPAAPTCSLTRRRGDAQSEGLPHRRGSDVYEDKERERPEASGEPAWAEVDASLRPLARALLALAEQLSREEAP